MAGRLLKRKRRDILIKVSKVTQSGAPVSSPDAARLQNLARDIDALAETDRRLLDLAREMVVFRESGPNLIQINVRGRILEIEYGATEELLSTEEFRVPYTVFGAV